MASAAVEAVGRTAFAADPAPHPASTAKSPALTRTKNRRLEVVTNTDPRRNAARGIHARRQDPEERERKSHFREQGSGTSWLVDVGGEPDRPRRGRARRPPDPTKRLAGATRPACRPCAGLGGLDATGTSPSCSFDRHGARVDEGRGEGPPRPSARPPTPREPALAWSSFRRPSASATSSALTRKPCVPWTKPAPSCEVERGTTPDASKPRQSPPLRAREVPRPAEKWPTFSPSRRNAVRVLARSHSRGPRESLAWCT